MSVPDQRRLSRVLLGLTLLLAVTLMGGLIGAFRQGRDGNFALALTWVTDAALVGWVLWTTRGWVRGVVTGQWLILPERVRQAARAWTWLRFNPVISAAVLAVAPLLPGVEQKATPLVVVLLPALISWPILGALGQAAREWLEDATRVLTGEQGSVPADRSRRLLAWLTFLQVVQAASALSLFSLMTPSAPVTTVDVLAEGLTSAGGVLGFLTATWFKGIVRMISAAGRSPVTAGPVGTRPSRFRKVWMGLGLVLALGVLALAGFGWWSERGARAGTLGLERGVTPQGQYFYGRADAPVTVTEYADFQCPGCQSFATMGRASFLRDELRAGQVRMVFADFPLPFHANAEDAAVAVRCAGEAGKFWEYHDELFSRQGEWAREDDPAPVFARLARRVGVPLPIFEPCLVSAEPREFVRASVRRGNALKLPGTPSFTVNGQPVPWTDDGTVDSTLESVRRAVRKALDE